MNKIGEITHYYGNIDVGIVKLTGELNVGDTIKVQGATTDFDQEITEMQLDHESIDTAQSGQEVGIKLSNKARVGDEVFLV